MMPLENDRPRPTLGSGFIRLLLVVSLVAAIVPALPAWGNPPGRASSKKAKPPKPKPAKTPDPTVSAQANKIRRGPTASKGRRTNPKVALPARTVRPKILRPPMVTPPPIAPTPAEPESVEEALVALANQARQAGGLPPLAVDDRLTRAAQIQAGAMAALEEMNHTLPGVPLPTLKDRLESVGYNAAWAGENLGFNTLDAATVHALWMDSPPHRDHILSPIPTSIGVAVAYSSRGEAYYCQVFGLPSG